MTLIDQFSTNDFFGSSKYVDINSDEITNRNYLINYIQKINISDDMVEWIETNMPNKLIKVLQPPTFINFDLSSDFKKSKYYIKYVSEVLEYFKNTMVNQLPDYAKDKFIKSVSSYDIIPRTDYKKFINIEEFDEKTLDELILYHCKIKSSSWFKPPTVSDKRKYVNKILNLNHDDIFMYLKRSILQNIVYNKFNVVLEYLERCAF